MLISMSHLAGGCVDHSWQRRLGVEKPPGPILDIVLFNTRPGRQLPSGLRQDGR